jgi:hypothetical protein
MALMNRAFYWRLCVLVLFGILSAGCGRQSETTEEAVQGTPDFETTADPLRALTLQADVQATAAGLATLAPVATPTPAGLPGFVMTPAQGTPPAGRTGQCPVPDGYDLHYREGFCLSAPITWTPLNVDGGPATSLGTTPGQAIQLLPDWAPDADVCHLLIYIRTGEGVEEHLQTRYVEFAARNQEGLTPMVTRSLGGMVLPGFVWDIPDGAGGGIYADSLGANRLVHISYGGSLCPVEQLAPILETLRFE